MATYFDDYPEELRLLRGEAVTRLTDAEFFQFCQDNPLQQFERDANHQLVLMPPSFPDASEDGSEITGQLWNWNRRTRAGHTYESSAGFKLSNSAVRAPDASWMSCARRAVAQQAGGFLAACSEFVVEIRSPSNRLATLPAKMQEYLENGALLGFLLDVTAGTAYVYRPGQPTETVQGYDQALSGEPVLFGFQLDLRPLRRLG